MGGSNTSNFRVTSKSVNDGYVQMTFTVRHLGHRYYVRTYSSEIRSAHEAECVSCTCRDFIHRQVYTYNPRCKHITHLIKTGLITERDL